ncbi:unnamed protein product [Owenia fusiformis]|uniref:Uncharacterized protein n=1 Tax=Owenia fusiformis TaxID=6347 RepID=A0A8J1TSU1_OWEFU|nr:unnamed protein product [Owenia fusiformis]
MEKEIKSAIVMKDEDKLKSILSNLDTCPCKTLLWAMQEYFIELSLATIKTLIHKGADINARDNQGKTVLMIAIEIKYTPCAELLIYYGADIHVIDNSGQTALNHITDFSPAYQHLYCLLTILGANDKQYQHLSVLLHTIATEGQIKQACEKIDLIKSLSKLRLKYRVRTFLFENCARTRDDYRKYITELVDVGHLPPGLKSFLLFVDDISEMMAIVRGSVEGWFLYSRDPSIFDDFDNFQDSEPLGTIGGLVALVDPDTNNTSQDEIFSLSANHQILPDSFGHHREYVTWSEVDYQRESVLTIGSEVPYRIPLKFDEDDDLENDSPDDMNFDDIDLDRNEHPEQIPIMSFESEGIDETESDTDDEEEPTFDIACIRVENETIRSQYRVCSLHECCSSSPKKELVGSTVMKLGSGPNATKGRLLAINASGEVKVGRKTVFVNNVAVICALDDIDLDAAFSNKGDGGTIVCIQDTIIRRDNIEAHCPHCFMIFAGWDKYNQYNKWGRPVTLAFSLYDSLKILESQVKENHDVTRKHFRLSCCSFALQ